MKASQFFISTLKEAPADAKDFEGAVLKAVNLGDDADTTGGICGQLAGAFWGESNISKSLRSGLARMDMLENALAGIL
jgi:ADP-ribosyl-[dinitrogen reductase] hydrolase